MKPKHPKHKDTAESIDELDDGRPVRFEALGELTQSDVIEQVKAGMSRIAPLESLEDEDDLQEEAA